MCSSDLLWKEREVLPLTPAEERAYAALDSTQTLDKQFQPKGPLSSLSGDGLDLLDYLSFRFDRAEGFYLGLHGRSPVLDPRLVVYGEEDIICPPRHSRQIASLIPGARLVGVPEQAHQPFQEDPAAFNELVLAFIAGD